MVSLPEKFFTERELTVLDDEGIEPRNAKQWFEALDSVIQQLPKYEHDGMGLPLKEAGEPFPQEGVNHARDRESSQVWFFRGQKDASYAFNSTLYRRLLNALREKDSSPESPSAETPRALEQAMVDAEIALLKKAERNGVVRGLTPLEKLTVLQHHGAPTRLLDVTSDWKVALFFACEDSGDRDGRVFLIRTSVDRWKDFPNAKNLEDDPQKLVWEDYVDTFSENSGVVPKYSWLSGVWPILLPFSDPRMIAQRGFFLVGGLISLKGWAALYTSVCENCKKKICDCGSENYGDPSEESLSVAELRQVTSLSVKFAAKKPRISDLQKAPNNKWTAIGYSVRVPKEFKSQLLELLEKEGIRKDSMYPPLSETRRLFEHVVDESLKRK